MGSYDFRLWNDIKTEANLLSAYSVFALGNGKRILFWKIVGVV